MIVVAHRRNTLAERDATPAQYGVELDVRVAHGRVVVTHDPVLGPAEDSVDLPTLDAWLAGYRGALLIVNVKEEGIEDVVRASLARAGVTDWFFLDQSMAALMKTVRSGESRVAVRVSDVEHAGTALALAGRAAWVWLDAFTPGLPVHADTLRALRDVGYRICLVSPELHGRDDAEIDTLRGTMAGSGVTVDAVCTRRWERWAVRSVS